MRNHAKTGTRGKQGADLTFAHGAGAHYQTGAVSQLQKHGKQTHTLCPSPFVLGPLSLVVRAYVSAKDNGPGTVLGGALTATELQRISLLVAPVDKEIFHFA